MSTLITLHRIVPYSIGVFVVVILWYLDFQLPVQSVPITTKVVSSNSTHDDVYSMIQHYVIQFGSELRQIHDFLRFLRQ